MNPIAHAPLTQNASTTTKPPAVRRRVEKFYDEVWTRYVPETGPTKEHLQSLLPKDRIEGARILDAGCGTGVFSACMAQLGAAHVTGLDISPGALSTAHQTTSKLKLKTGLARGSLDTLPLKSESFDLVWAWGAVEHTEHPWQVLAELHRVLRPGGTLVLALYKQSRWTRLHGGARAVFSRLPNRTQAPLSRLMAWGLNPVVNRFKQREKMRQGETLQGLVHDWFFVPIRHHFCPDRVRVWLEQHRYTQELFIPSSARFEVSSHFIYRSRKEGTPSHA